MNTYLLPAKKPDKNILFCEIRSFFRRQFYLQTVFFVFGFFMINIYVNGQTSGCTDYNATNYNVTATINDGSCLYSPTNYNPAIFINMLPNLLEESSGLLFFDGDLWTHNDSGGEAELYKIDTANGSIIDTIKINNATNIDWEDITHDSLHIYIGDIGNNNGDRTNLKIYIIEKAALTNNNVNASIISYSYSDQISFTPSHNSNNFDCEAISCYGDSIYLFSKNWINGKTKLYCLPKSPGSNIAELIDSLNIDGLVTGVDFNQNNKEFCLVGYKNYVPFIFLLFDFQQDDFFSGNKRRIDFSSLTGVQTEGITYGSGKTLYISCESSIVNQKVFTLSSSNWTNIPDISFENKKLKDFEFIVSPNPADSKIEVKINGLNSSKYIIDIIDVNSVVHDSININNIVNKVQIHTFDIVKYSKGMYFVRLKVKKQSFVRKIFIN